MPDTAVDKYPRLRAKDRAGMERTPEDRLMDWERKALAFDDLHSEINHLRYCLREVTRAKQLRVAKQIANTALEQ